MRHLDIFVKGYVQGVGFRYFVLRHAEALCVKGIVKNLSDGRVYIEAEGEEHQLVEFISKLRIGPSGADVREVDYKDSQIKNFDDFSITR